jgi:DNA-binding MarR family transcriptional regulator
MEKKHLIRRCPDPDDRRRNLVELGPSGNRKADLLGFFREINATLLRGFSTREAEQVVALLERIVENAERGLAEMD